MRKRAQGGGLSVNAISGNHAVFLGFDLDDNARDGCLGFALWRRDHTEDEEYWTSGFKTFESVVPDPDPAVYYSTRNHPIQSFYWGDYSAKPGYEYTYRVVPLYGEPQDPVERDGIEATVTIETNDPSRGKHGVYFNRGAAASQAYARKFGQSPGKLPPEVRAEAMEWLSRGLAEALLGFIGKASSSRYALRAAVYEFTHDDVVSAFAMAHDDGADVQIVYHAKEGDTAEANRAAIQRAGLDETLLIPRTRTQTLQHNKFAVLCERSADGELDPVEVWTGSTNMTEGGIYGHSNVGHVVRDKDVARIYLDYWAELSKDPPTAELRTWSSEHTPDAGPFDDPGTYVLMSPRRGLAPLRWYARRFGEAQVVANITVAFGLDKEFEKQLVGYQGDALHYVALERVDPQQAEWTEDSKVLVAVGSKGGPDQLQRWAKETLTGYNHWVAYLHTKVLLIDPLSADPTVITGSANYSEASTDKNDENMLVIRGDTDVADVYFTEFARIFNHFYARWWAAQLSVAGAETKSFLVEGPEWQEPYFSRGNPKYLQRVLYGTRLEV